MNRIFGTKSTAPKPTLNEAIGGLEERISSLDVRLAKLNGELTSYQQKMANMRDGPGKNAIKQRALKVLKQRKQIEVQRDQLQSQSWNMEQASMTSENLRNTMATLDAMKTANKELKKQYGKVNVDKIEQLQDEMADLMDMADELQDTMSRNYSVADDVDEAELDAELEALGEELDFEQAEPSYLQEEMPTFVDEQEEPAVANAAQ